MAQTFYAASQIFKDAVPQQVAVRIGLSGLLVSMSHSAFRGREATGITIGDGPNPILKLYGLVRSHPEGCEVVLWTESEFERRRLRVLLQVIEGDRLDEVPEIIRALALFRKRNRTR